MAKDDVLSELALTALHGWALAVRETCILAGQPQRAVELLAGGEALPFVRAKLRAAAAHQLRPDEPLALLEVAPDVADEDEPVSPEVSAELAAALRYARTAGDLCALAGYPEKAEQFILAGLPLFRVRADLRAAQAAKAAENPVCNLHSVGMLEGSAPTLPDPAKVYAARAKAMGQEPRP